MIERARLLGIGLVLLIACARASAQFGGPEPFGWSRSDADATWVFWTSFVDPAGGNPPVEESPAPRPTGFSTPDVVALSPTTFRTGSFNLYDSDNVPSFEVRVPQFARRGGYVTKLVVSLSTLGNPPDTATFRVNGVGALGEPDVINSIFLGPPGPFGGTLIDQQMAFELPGSVDEYVFAFTGSDVSVSLDQVGIDAFPVLRGCSTGDLAEPFGVISQADVAEFVDAFFVSSPLVDYVEPFDVISQADVAAFIDLFFVGCP
ncbi:MAG: hypothetical protein AAFR38_03765 [Planctomycetota bacterium]